MDLEPTTTSDTPLAAYLLYHNHRLVGMIPDTNDRKRLVFAFVKQENTDLLIDDFYQGDPQVNPQIYYKKTKLVHEAIREAKMKDERQ